MISCRTNERTNMIEPYSNTGVSPKNDKRKTMCQWGANGNPDPHVSPNPKLGVEKYRFQIVPKRLEIDENVNRARLARAFLAVNLCLEQLYSFRQSPN